jgi:cysteinyl-tRNA synthetase
MTPILRLKDQATRSKKILEPIVPGRVSMYVCGPTVHGPAHIGNARSAIVFDVLHRLLKATYPSVHYVRNITDVDDKINAAARERGVDSSVIARKAEEDFRRDMAALDCLPPDVEPRATEHVADMIAMSSRLIERGHAYEAAGHVLFSVSSMDGYGALSGASEKERRAGARVEIAPFKNDPADFVLWKPSDPTLPGWDSPWGRGRPGWHIEGSAMSLRQLGPTIDIHGGGRDLVFPHHENEIAQSVCANGAPLANSWVHNGHLVVNGRKRSKSLGNVILLRDLLDRADGNAIRLALLSAHYGSTLDWSEKRLDAATAELKRLRSVVGKIGEVDERSIEPDQDVMTALLDDLNVPGALAALRRIAREIDAAKDDERRKHAAGRLIGSARLLGLRLDPVKDEESALDENSAISIRCKVHARPK